MTTPTTPEQAYKLAREAWTWSDQHEQAAALESLAEQVEALTADLAAEKLFSKQAMESVTEIAAQRDALDAEVLLKAEYCRTTSNAHEAACAERDALRTIIVDSVDALGTAASVSQTSSIEFLQDVPGEIRKTVGALKADGGRYQKIRAETRVQRGSCFEQIWFVLPEVKPIPGVNIQNGNVAQHLDAAIDATMKAES